ncbi:MAG: acyl-CoA thioesterase [Actinomycetota bacterium]
MKRHIYTMLSRWGDIDGFGHVNNAAYLTYIQEARVDFTWYARKRKGEKPYFLDMVVARSEVDYIVPIYDGHSSLEVAVWVGRIGNSSYTLKYEVMGQGVTYAKASTVQVTVDMETKRSRPITDDERAFLLEFQEDGH